MQQQRASLELPFQPSEVAMISSQIAAAASSDSSGPDVETWVRVPGRSGQKEQGVERIRYLPLLTACSLEILHHYRQQLTTQHTS